MKSNEFRIITLSLFIIINYIYFAKSSTLLYRNDELNEEEASGMDTNLMPLDLPWSRLSKYEQNIYIMEEKIKSLSETFNQLELKINSLINYNMDLLQNNLRKIMQQLIEEKTKKLDEILNEGIKLINYNKSTYNVQEIKCSDNRFPNSCYDLNKCSSNIYSIMIPELNTKPFLAVCDLKTLDGGWTIIQRRQDGFENFYRNWTDYVEGFGNLNGEFFIGLEQIYALTSLGEPQELYIILEDFEGERRFARYAEFKVDSKNTDYKLTVSEYSGDAGDCFTKHSGQKFTTKDRDNDMSSDSNCAVRSKGAWWYLNCYFSNLNGLYLAGKTSNSKEGVSWCHFRNYEYSLKFVQMMIRPKQIK